jgi:hypothetical protein
MNSITKASSLARTAAIFSLALGATVAVDPGAAKAESQENTVVATVTVPATTPPPGEPTGVLVAPGDLISFSAPLSQRATYGSQGDFPCSDPRTDPSGERHCPGAPDKAYPCAIDPNNGFCIGEVLVHIRCDDGTWTEKEPAYDSEYIATCNGEPHLLYNDTIYSDNGGSYVVTVTVN